MFWLTRGPLGYTVYYDSSVVTKFGVKFSIPYRSDQTSTLNMASGPTGILLTDHLFFIHTIECVVKCLPE